ncbi:DUF930 domain-containing protein, partial [Hansschlegelia beijingensis]
MRRLACALALLLNSAPCSAVDAGLAASLRRLEPETRFHQLCDIETMRRIQQEGGALRPDRMVMDAIRPATAAGDTLSGSVPHTADEMFDLVADVEKYPLFLPLCEALRIRRRE